MERDQDFDEVLYQEIVTELMEMGYDRKEAEMYAFDMMEPGGANG